MNQQRRWALRNLPAAAYCPLEGNIEHHINPYFAALALKSEAQFDANLAALADRVEKIKGSSKTVLPELGVAGRRFDFAYIDGSHRAADVYADAALTWPLMERDGLVLFDDYLWDGMDEELEEPKPARVSSPSCHTAFRKPMTAWPPAARAP
jgi:Methyltransferase domain